MKNPKHIGVQKEGRARDCILVSQCNQHDILDLLNVHVIYMIGITTIPKAPKRHRDLFKCKRFCIRAAQRRHHTKSRTLVTKLIRGITST